MYHLFVKRMAGGICSDGVGRFANGFWLLGISAPLGRASRSRFQCRSICEGHCTPARSEGRLGRAVKGEERKSLVGKKVATTASCSRWRPTASNGCRSRRDMPAKQLAADGKRRDRKWHPKDLHSANDLDRRVALTRATRRLLRRMRWKRWCCRTGLNRGPLPYQGKVKTLSVRQLEDCPRRCLLVAPRMALAM
jgi:hypothetical protein